jgi:Lon protease-like protein
MLYKHVTTGSGQSKMNFNMYNLPLFPLNTVLFPGIPIHLHIFEPRYLEMVQMCLQNHKPFGVILIRQGAEANGPLADPFSVGCSARIMETEELEDGRLNITALGEDRFRVLNLITDLPYLSGMVESVPMHKPCNLNVLWAVRKLRPNLSRYLKLLSQSAEADGLDLEQLALPEDPLLLINFAASLIQIPPIEKQPILEAGTTLDMVQQVLRLCRRENLLLEQAQADSFLLNRRRAAWLN